MGNSAPEPQRVIYRKPEPIITDVDESLLPQPEFTFDRETMGGQEGFWAVSKEDGGEFPIRNDESWPGKQQFLAKLQRVEKLAISSAYDGHAPCRLQGHDGCTKAANGCEEYALKIPTGMVSWPSGYYHYLEVHNVKPSKNFYYLIMRADQQLKDLSWM